MTAKSKLPTVTNRHCYHCHAITSFSSEVLATITMSDTLRAACIRAPNGSGQASHSTLLLRRRSYKTQATNPVETPLNCAFAEAASGVAQKTMRNCCFGRCALLVSIASTPRG